MKPRVEARRAPDVALDSKDQKRVMTLVERIQQSRHVPIWIVWTTLYRFVAQQVWHVRQAEHKEGR